MSDDTGYYTKWTETIDIPYRYVYKYGHTIVIRDTHRRGMSIAQLEELGKLVELVLEEHNELKDKFDPNKLITKDNINLYHINDMFILPFTQHEPGETPFSFVELITENGDPDASWFVSHWWGTPFFDTLRMLKLHAKQRKVDHYNEFYWICAFANCQHALGELKQINYLQTPFARALTADQCNGTVVLLNERQAEPFRRSWCVFESFVSTVHCAEKSKPHWMDFATIIPEGECENSSDDSNTWKEYLVYGYTDSQVFNQRCAGLLYQTSGNRVLGTKRKTNETTDHPGNIDLAWFPGSVSTIGFRVNISKSQATREEDKCSIDRWIGNQRDLVNTTLRLMFVRSGMYMAATGIGELKVLREFMESPLLSTNDAIEIANDEGIVNDTAEYIGSNHSVILRYLLERGCNPDLETCEGCIPLNTAFKYRNYDKVRILLEFGADVNLLDTDIVLNSCPEDILQILKNEGADEEEESSN